MVAPQAAERAGKFQLGQRKSVAKVHHPVHIWIGESAKELVISRPTCIVRCISFKDTLLLPEVLRLLLDVQKSVSSRPAATLQTAMDKVSNDISQASPRERSHSSLPLLRPSPWRRQRSTTATLVGWVAILSHFTIMETTHPSSQARGTGFERHIHIAIATSPALCNVRQRLNPSSSFSARPHFEKKETGLIRRPHLAVLAYRRPA